VGYRGVYSKKLSFDSSGNNDPIPLIEPMTPENLYTQFVNGFPARKFSAGLLIALIDLYMALDIPGSGYKDFSNVLLRYPKQDTTGANKRANTLIVGLADGRTLSLRPFYNAAERFFRAEHKRFDYPSCAPHATQAWGDYIAWLDSLATFTVEQVVNLRKQVSDHVLTTLVSQAFDPASIQIEPPLFRLILEGFDMQAKRGEPTGAAFQGIVFGFLRADNPHLQIEIEKVRTGSKRLQRVGDIDGWEGARLAISAEVKQFEVIPDTLVDLEGFANDTGRRGALGLLVALGFKDGADEIAINMGLRALDLQGLIQIVDLWDPLKQRTAVSSLIYYAKHIEKNSSLAERVENFVTNASDAWTEKWSKEAALISGDEIEAPEGEAATLAEPYMDSASFIEIYARMNSSQKEELDELIELKIQKEEELNLLICTLNDLSAEELKDLERGEDEFLRITKADEREIDNAKYSVDDPEEAELLRRMELANLHGERYERLTSSFPIGVEILGQEIEEIEDKMTRMIPTSAIGTSRHR
jgi:hypothetical protein